MEEQKSIYYAVDYKDLDSIFKGYHSLDCQYEGVLKSNIPSGYYEGKTKFTKWNQKGNIGIRHIDCYKGSLEDFHCRGAYIRSHTILIGRKDESRYYDPQLIEIYFRVRELMKERNKIIEKKFILFVEYNNGHYYDLITGKEVGAKETTEEELKKLQTRLQIENIIQVVDKKTIYDYLKKLNDSDIEYYNQLLKEIEKMLEELELERKYDEKLNQKLKREATIRAEIEEQKRDEFIEAFKKRRKIK